ncbi:hypothetical protein TCAL_01890 [Tigriopus californicus]|uniref:SH3 domain-binding protein 5-like n=1 Tax=Tigriopus californicus TaxID=6832 RepID=A0A553P5W0_TIGCA|nr:SH3 domain-binding protein 5 homolog [Tigriopus californicus]TRY73030.1 hypothetical protein TCAL_01890 [Tigriopus californicus]|eukprot:TCALIF_01890-PA protein Name:"Similar to pcs SH3 domain-binding protein 5 homolog (Drosophila melanogaster)" AED:0.05 eAED:0.05 QI:0/-1/0/1/-1/1/1/0/384
METPGPEVETEVLDPRVQEELEKLNVCTEEINQLEVQLEDANCLFRTLLSDSTHMLKAMAKKVGGCIEKARPYYEALEVYQKAQKECQSAATHYQRASGIHAAAKETIALAEQRFLSNSNDWKFDNAWQEMLNHATIKVMEAEKTKTDSEAEHMQKADAFQVAEAEVQRLEKKLSRHIQKSQPYFEQKDRFNKTLVDQKSRVQELQQKIAETKAQYAQSLRNLEEISESIHQQRRLRMPREPGVGAELNSLPSYDLDECDMVSNLSMQSGDTYSLKSSDTQEEKSNASDDLLTSLDKDLSAKLKLSQQESQVHGGGLHKRSLSCPSGMTLPEWKHPGLSPVNESQDTKCDEGDRFHRNNLHGDGPDDLTVQSVDFSRNMNKIDL